MFQDLKNKQKKTIYILNVRCENFQSFIFFFLTQLYLETSWESVHVFIYIKIVTMVFYFIDHFCCLIISYKSITNPSPKTFLKISVPFLATAPTLFLLHDFWFCLLAYLFILTQIIGMPMELERRGKIIVAIRKIIENFLSYEILLLRFIFSS